MLSFAGWFRLLNSQDLAVEESKSVTALGLELAVFRSSDGKVAVLDAYCPHLGANLGGGHVEGVSIACRVSLRTFVIICILGDRLHCPFHGWQFDKEGVCQKIPYCDASIPSNATVKSHPSIETNGQILFWFAYFRSQIRCRNIGN